MTAKGMALERYLDRLHKLYSAQGRALLFKVPTPVQIQKRVGGIKIKGEKRRAVWVDYSGMFKGGTAIALEAKSFSGTGVSYSLSGRLKPHQMATLEAVSSFGGIAAVYVRRMQRRSKISGYVPFQTQSYLIPVSFLAALTKKSFRWDEVQQYKIPPGKTWLDCAPVGNYDDHEINWLQYCRYGWPEHKWCPVDGMGQG